MNVKINTHYGWKQNRATRTPTSAWTSSKTPDEEGEHVTQKKKKKNSKKIDFAKGDTTSMVRGESQAVSIPPPSKTHKANRITFHYNQDYMMMGMSIPKVPTLLEPV